MEYIDMVIHIYDGYILRPERVIKLHSDVTSQSSMDDCDAKNRTDVICRHIWDFLYFFLSAAPSWLAHMLFASSFANVRQLREAT